MSLRASSDATATPPRVAYAIGRRVGSAVDRNRARRRLRAAVAACADDLRPGGAYLFGADRAVLSVPFAELCASVASLVHAATTPGSAP